MRLAILDNDRELCAHVVSIMGNAGHSCSEFHSEAALASALRFENFDLMILDSGISGLSGADLLASVRSNLASPPPVIMLMHPSNDDDTGADGHVAKPVEPAVLAAKVEALLSRDGSALRQETFSDHVFDVAARTIAVRGVLVEVTAKEFGLALLLFRNTDRTLSRTHIMETVWGRSPDAGSRTLDAHVSQIRKRLSLRPEHGLRLASVYGFGYRLERPEPDA